MPGSRVVVLLFVGGLAGALVACGGGSSDGADAASDAAGTFDGSADVVGELDGLRWELPCIADTTPELCTTAPDASTSATVAGTTGATYTATLRFRGIVEPKTYTGGTREGFFQVGGEPAADTANIYRLIVSAPAATFYVNAGTTRPSTELYCTTFDYMAEIAVEAGATVTLEAESLDDLQIQNRDEAGEPFVIADVPPAPAAFDGQFVQVDVVAVEELP